MAFAAGLSPSVGQGGGLNSHAGRSGGQAERRGHGLVPCCQHDGAERGPHVFGDPAHRHRRSFLLASASLMPASMLNVRRPNQ
jgi:hypothetical protein